MGFKKVQALDADNVIALGGKNGKTGKPNQKSAEGYYVGSRKVESKKSRTGFSYIHFLQTQDGDLGIWGKTDLDKKLLTVAPGTMVRVSFTGTKPTPNGPMYVYSVEQDTENTIEVGDLSAAGAQEDLDGSEEESVDEDTGYGEEVQEEVEEEAPPVSARSASQRSARREEAMKMIGKRK